ncbi:Uncharacterised protein [Mycobacteroides abscessus subsp. abscessus]|nr:Uncharacterised protein [Mycobacteroides abscessus subsp. abscessus]
MSYDGETKLSTTLMPTVAIAKRTAATTTTASESIPATSSTGSVIALPYFFSAASEMTIEITTKAVSLNGIPSALPRRIARLLGAKRAKSA